MVRRSLVVAISLLCKAEKPGMACSIMDVACDWLKALVEETRDSILAWFARFPSTALACSS